ncbi:MAG TPA: amino acid permease [Longimicrobiales bacterium]|nr:amino acid permease [Longimicrobiales bacterium]
MDLFWRKSIDQLHADAASGQLRRALGPVQLTTLGVGAIIGAGIFVLTGQAAAQHAGPAIVLSFILAGTACALAGLCYAEFASMIPVAGSAYTYAYATMGEFLAWIIGWDLILEYSLGAATVAVGWSGYVVSFLRDLGIDFPLEWANPRGAEILLNGDVVGTGIFNIPAAVITLLVTAVLVVGIRESASANAAIVLIKVAVVLLFISFGAAFVKADNWSPFIPASTGTFGEYGWSGVVRAAAVVFFAYIGFDAVSVAAQEAKNPQKDMPIGILASLAICTVLYIAVSLVLTGVVSYTTLNVPDPIAVGIDATGLNWLKPFIKLGAIAGLSSVILVMIMAQPRIFYAMSRDGLLPPVFKKIHPRYRTPHITTTVTGLAVAITAGLFPIGQLGHMVSIGTLLAFVIVCIGVLVLRYRQPEIHRPFRTPGMPVVPILGALSCFYLMSFLPFETWMRLLIWLVIGLAIYFLYGGRAAQRARAAGLTTAPPELADRH